MGEVAGRAAIVVDDMISTGGTIAAAVDVLLAHGARPEVAVLATLVPTDRRHGYDLATIKHWFGVYLRRFVETSQFKRSALPNGPRVGSGGLLSPRGDWRAPSDATARAWLEELERHVPARCDPPTLSERGVRVSLAGADSAGTAGIPSRRFDAFVFDLDGGVTDTASVHARAWQRLFNGYLRFVAERGGPAFEPFGDNDYRRSVDGRARVDGVVARPQVAGHPAPPRRS